MYVRLITQISCAAVLLLAGCAGNVVAVKYGVQDDVAAGAITRINQLSSMRTEQRYQDAADLLKKDLIVLSSNAYARARIENELADLYSFQLLDIEAAIELDEQLLRRPIPDADSTGNFMPKYNVASQKVLADRAYVDEFVSLSAQALRERAEQRLAGNRALVEGRRPGSDKSYDLKFLKSHLVTVRNDIASTPAGSADRFRILSRVIRAEYEIVKRDPGFKITGHRYFLDGQLQPGRVDLSEIDFLSLADYFSLAFTASGDVRFAEFALDTVYLPYVNLRNGTSRWRYNKLINDYISTLIEVNYQRQQYDQMLYYASLNKSRMLLEERLAFGGPKSGTAKIADFSSQDGIVRTRVGLPDKKWFMRRLGTSENYLDFYVGGKYGSVATGRQAIRKDRSTMPLTTRDFGVEDASEQADFLDDVLYIAWISNGRVALARKVTGAQLSELKSQLDSAYHRVSDVRQGGTAQPVPFFKALRNELRLPAKLTLSPDKWVAKHPMDMHLGSSIVRSVNFFTAGAGDQLDNLRIVGYFNPTLDLSGAEQEADAIRESLPQVRVFKRTEAQISALAAAADANVLHLSMHGAFNAKDPKNSKLYFAGAQRGLVSDDPNALYARDMANHSALRERELIFAAACQTGMSAADQANENELMGILRPLTANRNKNIILSLWKVDDAATKDFVAAFYQRLASTKDVATSFHFAQDEIRVKYKLPYYWAAFYLSQSR